MEFNLFYVETTVKRVYWKRGTERRRAALRYVLRGTCIVPFFSLTFLLYNVKFFFQDAHALGIVCCFLEPWNFFHAALAALFSRYSRNFIAVLAVLLSRYSGTFFAVLAALLLRYSRYFYRGTFSWSATLYNLSAHAQKIVLKCIIS